MEPRYTPFGAADRAYKAMLAIETYLKESGLEPRLMELVKVRVSQINGCATCLHMHTQDARKAGETETRLYLLEAWRESLLYTPRERAALAWAESLTWISDTHAPDDVFAEVRAQFTEKELADLSIAIAMINSWNRVLIAARSVHPADRAAAANAV
jgi:AhpD family alkylhydroperoxidase